MTWAPDYVTAAEFKAYVKIDDTDDDAQVALAVTSASRAVDNVTGRQFGQVAVAEARTYTAEWDRHRGRYVVVIDDLQTTVGLVVTVDGVVTTSYTLEPRNAVSRGKAWTQLVLGSGVRSCDRDGVSITASWGWTTVPVPVKQATLLQASRFLARRDSPYGVAGSVQDGSELRLLAAVDPDVRVALRGCMRIWGAV